MLKKLLIYSLQFGEAKFYSNGFHFWGKIVQKRQNDPLYSANAPNGKKIKIDVSSSNQLHKHS